MIKNEDAVRLGKEKYKDKYDELTKKVEEKILNTTIGKQIKVDCSGFPIVVVEAVLQDLEDMGWEAETDIDDGAMRNTETTYWIEIKKKFKRKK